ncbi:putative WD repeat-containing protein slr0143 [Synechocystis sp, PCC 6803 substr. Kazusa] [Rhizoctonia solani]|uniref:Putative WD repeat-containing protein slr0143 [Synechocystis sp, PCC 6803 substr. Kazusa] n=1 Tax=Rhizoctonia solani TaxID=456999 RepID=A0A0K6FU44_9AGAM|nr:putative WD repeat-containing protein slr0143 [Synechocystis sp, PCC 6803 substr. Kazusa] [Rhizoctonia solani]
MDRDYTHGAETELGRTQAPTVRTGPNRRQATLLALIDELTESRVKDLEKKKEKSFGLPKDEITSTDAEVIERFQTFDQQIHSLRLKLQSFASAIRPLGSSVGLINATHQIRAHLIQIRDFFRENATQLFDALPRPVNVGIRPPIGEEWGKSWRHSYWASNQTSETNIDKLPDELKSLATELRLFLKRLGEVPDFADSAVKTSIMAFEVDLKYHASCLEEYKDQLKPLSVPVSRFINDLTLDLGVHMHSMEDSLTALIDVGVPITRYSQEHVATGLQNLSTVATFMSGVTATILQVLVIYVWTCSRYSPYVPIKFSVSNQRDGDSLSDIVNGLWFSSLVFSIASAINSQLAYHWRAAIYHSPKRYVPWWVSIWITRTPLFFLVVSYCSKKKLVPPCNASVGLCDCLFNWAMRNNQSRAVCAIVTSFTVITSSALLCIGLWFASERWTFSRTKGKQWLLEYSTKLRSINRFASIERITKRGAQRIQDFFKAIKLLMTRSPRAERDEETPAITPVQNPTRQESLPPLSPVDNPRSFRVSLTHIYEHWRHDNDNREAQSSSVQAGVQASTPNITTGNILSGRRERLLSTRGRGNVEPIPENSPPAPDPSTPRASNSTPSSPVTRVSRKRHSSTASGLTLAHIQAFAPMLRAMQCSQSLTEHIALISYLHFSPDGKFFATCSWDNTVLIWSVGSGPAGEFELKHTLLQSSGFANQVAWRPNGNQLLTRHAESIQVWDIGTTTPSVNLKIDRQRHVQSITWMPKGAHFLSIEWKVEDSEEDNYMYHLENILGSDLVVLSTDETQHQSYHLSKLQVWDAAILPDEKTIVAVATLIPAKKGGPVKARHEKRILIYNLSTEKIEDQAPLSHDLRSITLTEEGDFALVSYENKAPPEGWGISKVATEGKRITYECTYFTKDPVDFAGPCCFGGIKDSFVLGASKGSDIYIWERSSGVLLHSLKAPGQQFTSLASSCKSPGEFTIATGTHDGKVNIWTTTAPVSPRNSMPVPEWEIQESREPQDLQNVAGSSGAGS